MPRLVLLLALSAAAHAQIMRGRVVLRDGSPPPERAIIERICPGVSPIQETVAGKRGEFFWRRPDDSVSVRAKGASVAVTVPCVLRARVRKMESEGLDIYDPKILRSLQLPPLVLHPLDVSMEGPRLPAAALKNWQAALKSHRAAEWSETERLARAVAKDAPAFASAWAVVGDACYGLDRHSEARDAYRKAIDLDGKSTAFRIQLLRVEIAAKDWTAAIKVAEPLAGHPEGRLHRGIARYMLNDTEGARADWQAYLELAPNSAKAPMVRAKLDELARETSTARTADELIAPVVEPPSRAIDAWIPGGRKALAAIARMPSVPEPARFFLEYCRAIAIHTSRHTDHPAPGFVPALQAYHGSVAALMALGEKRGDGVAVTIAPGSPKAARILSLLGWKLAERNGKTVVEPGEQPIDGPRQQIPRALGIDEFAMQDELQAGRPFRFEIAGEMAPVAGGTAWNDPLRAFPELPGGIAEAFIRDPKLARAYTGLAAMPEELAMGLIKSMGLHSLCSAHSDPLWQFGEALAGPIPGGPDAEPVWTKLAGDSPRDPVRFAEALLRSDRGSLASFYAAVAAVDPVRQRFVTANPSRAGHFHRWLTPERRPFLATFPIGDDGRVRFPGGRAAWSPNATGPDDEVLFPPQTSNGLTIANAAPPLDLEALSAVSDLERKRGVPLDPESARALARNYAEWRPLFPYFHALPRLTAADFSALDAFTRDASPSRMAQWYAAAEIVILARKAGSLDDAAAARAFGDLARSADTLAVLRAIAGPAPDLDEAIVANLLRIAAPRRASFDLIRAAQRAPRVSGAAGLTLALTGIVYAATLDPLLLVLHENRDLLLKHDFAAGHFAATRFAGGRFTGGLMSLREASANLSKVGRLPDVAPEADSGATFRASARLVELYPTVTDERGRHLDGLRANQFIVLDRGQQMSIAAFENEAASLSCAILLDTSLSMDTAEAALKGSAMRLIAGLRPTDSVAVYSLTGGISELQSFTSDKDVASKAVLRAELGELTALHDGLVRVNRDLAARTGKKAIVVFTDGEDTASAIDAEIAILRAKTAGVPIYTIAEGHAARRADLARKLSTISNATGGLAFSIGSAAEIGPVFDRVLQDLLHGYLLAFSPGAGDEHEWRAIEVHLKTPLKGKVRAREGYYPE